FSSDLIYHFLRSIGGSHFQAFFCKPQSIFAGAAIDFENSDAIALSDGIGKEIAHTLSLKHPDGSICKLCVVCTSYRIKSNRTVRSYFHSLQSNFIHLNKSRMANFTTDLCSINSRQ